MKLLIKNAELFDGENPESTRAHVLIENDKITAVLDAVPEGYQGEELDIEGLCLAPGFIDTHTHNDFYAVLPEAEKYCRSFVRQGITTMVGGNCGFSLLGVDPNTPYSDNLFAFFKRNPDFQSVTTFEGWSTAVNKYSPINLACLCGHGSLRTSIAGLGNNPLSAEQLQRMEQAIDEQLSVGAAGLSFGLMYDPGIFAPPKELLSLARIAEKHGKPLTYHTRANSGVSMAYPELLGRPHNLRAIDEVIDIAEKTGVRSHISHMIYVGRKTWKTLDPSLALLDDAKKRGLDISFDIYPFDCGASTICVILPTWYQALPAAKRKTLPVRVRLNVEILATKKLLGFGYEDIRIAWPGKEHPEYTGKLVSDIAREKKMKPLDTYLSIIDECGPETTVIMYTYMNDRIIDLLSRQDNVHYMTDAWIMDEGLQNPACFHAFPRLLRLSAEGKAEELGRMICKMTGGAAERFGIRQRGKIKPGYFADLVAFDKRQISDGTGNNEPVGLPHVLINGEFAVRDGVYREKNLGRALSV